MITQSYKMRTQNSCGIDAMHFALNNSNYKITYEELQRIWGIKKIEDFTNAMDTPLNHFNVLDKLKITYNRNLSSEDIKTGKAINNQTVILIHYIENEPEVRNLFTELRKIILSNYYEHWVVLHSVVNNYVLLHFGDGKIHNIKFETFDKLFNTGLVKCAYCIGLTDKTYNTGNKIKNFLLNIFSKLWGSLTKK